MSLLCRAWLVVVTALLSAACSGGVERGVGGSEPSASAADVIFPQGVDVSARVGTNSVFNLVTLTLRHGSSGVDLYAAVRNEGDVAACNPSFSVELRARDERALAAGISGLNVRDFYRLTDGSETVAGCVPPGARSVVAITDLSLDGALEDVSHVVYASSYWFLDAVAIEGIALSDVQVVNRGTGVAYTGTLLNQLGMTLDHPTVAVFPVNKAGRALGVAYGGSSTALPPGGAWVFETNSVSEAGVGYEIFPMGGP
jgi:hypothetical protein